MKGGQGVVFPPESFSFRDEATGALIHRLTSHPSINHATYFLQSSFYPDGSGLIFVSYRSGSPQLFEIADFPSGPIRQLTGAGPIHPFSPAIHPGGEWVFFVRGGSIWRLNRRKLTEVPVWSWEGAQLGECSLDRTGDWIVAAAKRGPEYGLCCGRADGSEWRVIRFPRTVIHPQFHPLEPEWIEFAADPAPRMHRVRRDGSGLECLYRHDNEEFVVHETFLGATGDVVYAVWPKALRRMDWTTREHRTIAEFNAWHITPDRAGARVLCDTNHPDEGLYVIDAASGHRRRICLSLASNQGTQWRRSRYALAEDFAAARAKDVSIALSWMETATDTVYGPQWTHPHPSWSPDESKIVFTSDRDGSPQVYVAMTN